MFYLRSVALVSGLALIAVLAAPRPLSAQPSSVNLLPATVTFGSIVDPRASIAPMALAPATGPTALLAVAQDERDGIGLGVKLGPIFSSFSAARANFGNNTGLQGGIFLGGNRPGLIGVMTEILYARKGAETAAGVPVDLHYLEVPLLLRINVGSGSLHGARLYGIAGPVVDVLLKARQRDIDVKDSYKGLDVGLIGGGGIEIGRFLVEGRYNWGLRNIADLKLAPTTKIHSRSFAVLFGVRFN